MRLPIEIIDGKKLMDRWRMCPLELAYMCLNGKLNPLYRELHPEPHWEDLSKLYSGLGEYISNVLKTEADIANLTFWLPEVLEVEKRYPELTSNSKRVLNESELRERWNLTSDEIYDLVRKSFIEAVDPVGEAIEFVNLEAMVAVGVELDAEMLFRLDDVEKIEKECGLEPQLIPVAGKKGLRPNQRHRLKCRKIAEEFWKKDPTMTIASVSETQEIIDACNGKIYIDKTIRDWIKDLCPNRTPGRRPKS